MNTVRQLTKHVHVNPTRIFQRGMASNLRQRAVVSSFICTSPQSPQGLTFALFKRSEGVSTYKGKWAVCSGSIDATDKSPELAAKREILEETTLDGNDIFLLRKGKPFSLIDEGLKTEWTIHPFAWQLKEGAKPITFDWEHTEYHFIKPEDIDTYDHVPQLEVGLNRVMVSPETESALAILKNDHESGAHALAIKSLELLLEMSKGKELAGLSTVDEFWKQIRWRAWHLAKNGRPSMGAAIEAALFNALARVSERGLQSSESDPQSFKKSLDNHIKSTIDDMRTKVTALATEFSSIADERLNDIAKGESPSNLHIITLSASGTIAKGLSALIERISKSGSGQKINIKLSVLESRPSFEGASFVNSLLASFNHNQTLMQKLQIDIVSDASMASVIKDANYFIFGADKVLPDGSVSNKIGSLAVAALAKGLNPTCKVAALFTTDKIVRLGSEEEHEKVEYNDEKELLDAWPASCKEKLAENRKGGWKVDVKNAYFEWVPVDYIDMYYTERAKIGKEDIQKISLESQEMEESLFGDL